MSWTAYDPDEVHATARIGNQWKCEACSFSSQDQTTAITHAITMQFTPGGPRPLTSQERRAVVTKTRAA